MREKKKRKKSSERCCINRGEGDTILLGYRGSQAVSARPFGKDRRTALRYVGGRGLKTWARTQVERGLTAFDYKTKRADIQGGP